MVHSPACPDGTVLEQLALGTLDPDSFETLAPHIQDCAACAQVLETIHAEDALVATFRSLERLPIPAPSALLGEVIRRARALSADTSLSLDAGALTPEADVDLSFLAPPQQPDELGRLGGFRVFGLLGQGGMGLVLEAEDLALGRRVALKVMKPALAARRSSRERFLREAQAAALVEDDHVVPIYQVGEEAGTPFLAMPLLKGQPLDRWLLHHPPDLAEVLRIGSDVARGLAAAHAQGLVHRDVKPANIWLDAPGEPEASVGPGRARLLDFGLARAAAEDVSLTQVGQIIGTPTYMSPEQARGDRVDARSDLFSLGCVLYRLLSGRPPFAGDSTLAVLTALAVGTPPPLTELTPAVPPALADLIARLLAKRPEDRPASADSVATALQAIATAAPDAAGGRPRRRALRAALGLLGLSLLVLGGITLVMQEGGGREAHLAPAPGGTRPAGGEEEPAAFPPLDAAWLTRVQGLKAEEQIKEIGAELERRNPDFRAATMSHQVEGDTVVELRVPADTVTDLSPVRALVGLQYLVCAGSGFGKGRLRDLRPLKGLTLPALNCDNTRVSDFTPLRGMPLGHLECRGTPLTDLNQMKGLPLFFLHFDHTAVADLEPLRGMRLESLGCSGTQVANLEPLRGMPLRELYGSARVTSLEPLRGMRLLHLGVAGSALSSLQPLQGMPLRTIGLDYKPERDRAVLRNMTTLQFINGIAAATFWKEEGR